MEHRVVFCGHGHAVCVTQLSGASGHEKAVCVIEWSIGHEGNNMFLFCCGQLYCCGQQGKHMFLYCCGQSGKHLYQNVWLHLYICVYLAKI